MSEPHAVVVYGATGFTGRLVCAELLRRKTSFAIAGRDGGKLDALSATLGGVERIVADLEPRALDAMAERGRVLLDCAGPFARLGRPVQDAALRARRHFLDVTGEAGYMRATAARDDEARERGIALVNAVGFDVVPTDAAALLASERAGAPIASLRLAFINQGGRPTQGTTRSALGGAHHGGLAFVDGEYRDEPVGAQRWEAPFPDPIGRRVCVSIPWGDLATAPRSTGARSVRVFMALPAYAARWLPLLRPLSKLMAFAPAQKIAERLVQLLPEGPSDGQRARGRFAIFAEAVGARTATAWVTGGDGYDFTAASAALCATRAAEPDFSARGALTPTQAFGARWMLDQLAGAGVRYGVG